MTTGFLFLMMLCIALTLWCKSAAYREYEPALGRDQGRGYTAAVVLTYVFCLLAIAAAVGVMISAASS